MLDLKQLENDIAKITDNLRNGLTNNLENYDINIKLTYDDLKNLFLSKITISDDCLISSI